MVEKITIDRYLEILQKGWMTKILFEDWFKNCLCPEVKDI